MGLEEYRKKRDFKSTPEPKGGQTKSKNELVFVVQKHEASHLHYDFRLEVDGVLKSWAVPKGPSMNPSDKRLAIEVEDHPFDYRTFEGTIPEGNYGAGTVMVWDEGTYQATHANTPEKSEQLMRQGLEDGHLDFILNGEKLKGEFSLIRLRGARQNQWLLIKKIDKFASKEDITQQDRSASSQRSMDEIGQGKKSSARKKPQAAKTTVRPSKPQKEEEGPIKSSMPRDIKPMLATLVEEPFDRPNWLFEMKWDGYRAIAEVKNHKVNLYSRNQQSFNKRFPPIAADLKELDREVVLDGEIVVLDDKDKPSFQLVQNYQRDPREPLVYYVFDLLYLDGYDLRHLPLIRRKEILKKILPHTPHIQYCEHIEEKGVAFFKKVSQKDYEGMIAKDGESPYREGRSKEWLKIKTHARQEAIICGFTPPKGAREKFGSLLLGVYENGELVYVGHTGSGFTRQTLTEVFDKLQPLIQSKSPFPDAPRFRNPVTWVKPELVCEISFAEWTQDEQMRQAIFVDLREDKKSTEVVKEQTIPVQQALKTSDRKTASVRSTPKSKNGKVIQPHGVELTHLDKIYWPDQGYTKGDLINYYKGIASYLLPYLKDRPETLHRYPNGIAGSSFFQKELEKPPAWIRTEEVEHEDRLVNYLLIEDENSLLYAANLGCIELNPFSARIQSLDHPDYMVLDLDPENLSFDSVVEVAQAIHNILDNLEIEAVCKTSGKRGMHIYVPLGAQYTFEQSRHLAEVIARFVHDELPDLTSLERNPRKRQKKVYIDYLQNNYAQTVVAPYSVRPTADATVSTPLKWSEVKKGLNPTNFTIKTMQKRLDKVGDLFEPALGKGINLEKCLKKLAKQYA